LKAADGQTDDIFTIVDHADTDLARFDEEGRLLLWKGFYLGGTNNGSYMARIDISDPSTFGLQIKMAESQTENPLEIQDDLGDPIFMFTKAGRVLVSPGTSGAPAFGFVGDVDSGWYRQTEDYLSLVVGGSRIMNVRYTSDENRLAFFGEAPVAKPAVNTPINEMLVSLGLMDDPQTNHIPFSVSAKDGQTQNVTEWQTHENVRYAGVSAPGNVQGFTVYDTSGNLAARFVQNNGLADLRRESSASLLRLYGNGAQLLATSTTLAAIRVDSSDGTVSGQPELGFFGAASITRPTVNTGATQDTELRQALADLGLINNV
jgi:hypothetical protein